MSSELERRLEGFLVEAPEPEPGVGEEALQRALDVLDVGRPQRPRAWVAGLALAAAVALLAVAAGALAATGTLHLSLGKPKARITTLRLPAGAHGIAVVVDGRLSVVTQSGFRLQGLRVSAAALSPHALYVAAGIGHSLVAMAPNGDRAWSHEAGGAVEAIAWAPDGLRIAYVVGHALHVIWGNGTHDTVVDRSVRGVEPSWRADSLAFAYAGAGGKAIVYDLAHRSRRVVARSAEVGPVTQLAFSLSGAQLAVAGKHGFLLGKPGRRMSVFYPPVAGVGWGGDEPAVVEAGEHAALRVDPQTDAIVPLRLSGRAVDFASGLYGFAIALSSRNGVEIVAGVATVRRQSGGWGLSSGLHTVLELPRGTSVRDLAVVR
jgi:hypothetical protein